MQRLDAIKASRLTRRGVLHAGLAASVAGVAALAPAACGTSGGATPAGGVASQAGPAMLSYFNWFAPGSAQDMLYHHALDVFHQHYPQVEIQEVKKPGGTTTMEHFLSLSAAGTTPDISALNPQFVEPLRARGALADLTSYVNRDARSFAPSDFYPATVLRAKRGSRWHAIPLQMGLWFVHYHVGLLQRAGLELPSSSWTWEEMVEMVRAVKSAAPDVLGMTMPPYELPVRDNGGDILSKDEKRCLLDQPPAVEAIQWNADLRLKQQVVPAPDQTAGQNSRQLFAAGRYVFAIGDPGFLSATQHAQLGFPWDIASVPKGKRRQVSTVKGPSLVIAQESKHKDLSWAWLALYTGKEMQRWVAVNGKIVSARRSALEAYVAVDEGFHKQVLLEVAKIAEPMPYVARYDEIDQEIQAGLAAVYAGQQSAASAMATTVQKVNALLAGAD